MHRTLIVLVFTFAIGVIAREDDDDTYKDIKKRKSTSDMYTVDANPIGKIAKTLKHILSALPEIIIEFITKMFGSFIDPHILHRKMHNILGSVWSTILRELPESYSSIFEKGFQFLDVLELIG